MMIRLEFEKISIFGRLENYFFDFKLTAEHLAQT